MYMSDSLRFLASISQRLNYAAMPPKEGEYSQPRDNDRLLFVHLDSESYQGANPRTIASRSRRRQTDRRHQDQRASAQREASYARNLVGWRLRSSNIPAPREPHLHIPPGLTSSTTIQVPNVQGIGRSEVPPTTILLQPTGGLRVDPFNALPVENNKNVMAVADYCTFIQLFPWSCALIMCAVIHVWALQKATNFDALLGYNTYLERCWPFALQDDMLLDATLAASRAAWCLAQRRLPGHDHFLLRHSATALSKLRQRISSTVMASDESIVFTMDYMLNVAYMTKEHSAFSIHWTAFRSVAEGFMAARPNEEISAVVSHRLRGWEALDAYRKGVDPLRRTLSSKPPLQTRQFRNNHDSSSWQQHHILSDTPPGFAKLGRSGSLCVEVIEVVVQLVDILSNMSEDLCRVNAHVTNQLTCLLSSEHLSDFELQVSYTLLALALYLDCSSKKASDSTSARRTTLLPPNRTSRNPHRNQDSPPLDTIAQAFINKKLCLSHSSDLERRCLIWCSLVLGSILLSLHLSEPTETQNEVSTQRLRGKGHIILVACAEKLVPKPSDQAQDGNYPDSRNSDNDNGSSWEILDPDFLAEQFLCTPALATQWRRSWEATVKRQQEWEEKALLVVGLPQRATEDEKSESVDIEYLVLREGRESLPRVLD